MSCLFPHPTTFTNDWFVAWFSLPPQRRPKILLDCGVKIAKVTLRGSHKPVTREPQYSPSEDLRCCYYYYYAYYYNNNYEP